MTGDDRGDKVDNVKKQLDSVKDDLDCEKEAREKALHDVSEKTRKSVEEVEKRFTKITDEMEEATENQHPVHSPVRAALT